ncbi:glycerophosphodiester phosphodiesterase family protein [Woodsholea maritima]|uniref:glycerophosphodiester phosphodiesterase family protein n=1 Tax=Woodsholea maritima TaxID=240237 RepID=UPI00035C4944|nr:glycerophosphodiester phosphodiesterase family protein [Woodsholea maritima]
MTVKFSWALASGLSASLMLVACHAPQGEAPTETVDHVGADSTAPHWQTLKGQAPLIIAHRGASGERPEHTLSAYKRALDQGADIIEPDLVMTRDGVLIIRHDGYLSDSTDVANHPEFADRRRTLFDHEDWWAIDFTLEEIKTLRARQTRPSRGEDFDGQDEVLTFEEFLDFVASEQAACDCTITIEPEVKAPAEHAAVGLDPMGPLLAALHAYDLNRADAPIIIQSFDPEFLERLNAESPVRLAMLDGGDLAERGYDMDRVASFAEVIAPYKYALYSEDDGSPTGYVEAAHAAGLYVHTWTVRDDDVGAPFVTSDEEFRHIFGLGVDGVFTDFPATGLAVRADMSQAQDN